MQLVLCDVCRKNTNREVPIGTLTKTYRKNFRGEILMTTIDDNEERLHVCVPCFSTGKTASAKAAELAAGTPSEGSAG